MYGTGNNSGVRIGAGNSAYAQLTANGMLISGIGIYAIRSGTYGVNTGPAYTFDSDRDTGIYRDGTNELAMSGEL